MYWPGRDNSCTDAHSHFPLCISSNKRESKSEVQVTFCETGLPTSCTELLDLEPGHEVQIDSHLLGEEQRMDAKVEQVAGSLPPSAYKMMTRVRNLLLKLHCLH